MKKQSMPAVLCVCLSAIFIFTECRFEKPSPIDEKPNEIVLNEAGAVISMPFIWETDVSEEDFIWVVATPIFHRNTVIVPGSPKRDKGMLVALDIKTGEEVWRWSDEVAGYDFGEVSTEEQLNSKNGIAIYNASNLFWAVDLDKGTTLWKDKREGHSSSRSIQIVGDHYYFPFEIEKNGVFAETLMRGSIHSTDYEQIIELPMASIQLFNDAYGTFHTSHIYTEKGSTKAFIPFAENIYLFKGKQFHSYISYNITNQTYDFEKVRLPDTLSPSVVTRPSMIRDMVIVSASHFIYGTGRFNGEVVWTRKIFAGSPSNGRIMTATYKDRLFAVNHTGSRDITMELNPLTGTTKWIDVGNGGSAYPALYFLNDVLYFASRGDGRLYAYDINGGKMLWKLKSPDYEGFMTMQVHKAASAEDEDMLVACSWRNAYRFEPAR